MKGRSGSSVTSKVKLKKLEFRTRRSLSRLVLLDKLHLYLVYRPVQTYNDDHRRDFVCRGARVGSVVDSGVQLRPGKTGTPFRRVNF